MKEEGVSILPGEAFEQPGFFRLGLGSNPKTFASAMEAMSQFITDRSWLNQ